MEGLCTKYAFLFIVIETQKINTWLFVYFIKQKTSFGKNSHQKTISSKFKILLLF